MRVYSPSSTTTFARCPQMWEFYRKGYQPKQVGRVEVAAAAGIGFAKAMEVWYSRQADSSSKASSIAQAALEGRQAGYHHLDSRIAAGGILSDDMGYSKLGDRIEKAVTKFVSGNYLPGDWQTFTSELVFPDHGNCRVDLLCHTGLGACIVDFKTKITRPQPHYLASFISGFEYSWQMYHYVWAARQMGIDAASFAIVVVCFEPFQVDVEQWVVDESYLEQWQNSAVNWWMLMEEAEYTEAQGIQPDWLYPMSPTHTDQYGLCRYADTCFSDGRGRGQWDRTLIQVERS